MPLKILLADKSITIQKVVEMLFSGRDYEVVCVSDGEAALNEAVRSAPDVVLADVDLPRLDGYTFAARLKQKPQLAQTPVILMMSRDDVYDSARGKQAGISDNIAKPFESQELIGKVKKALAGAPPRLAEPAPAKAAETPPPAPAARHAVTTPSAKPTQAAPADIFDIIQEAPTGAEVKIAAAPASVVDDSEYEVEAEVEEVEEPLAGELEESLPIGAKAVEEMRAGLGLTGQEEEVEAEILPFESFEMAMETEAKAGPATKPAHVGRDSAFQQAALPPVQTPTLPESELRKMAEEAMAKLAKEAFAAMPPPQVPAISPSELWGIAEVTIAKMAKDVFAQMPPLPSSQVPDDMVRAAVEEKVEAIAREVVGNMPLPGATLPESELRSMAEQTISQMAADIFRDMPPPPLPKISDETVRRGLEAVLATIAREMAKEVIEQVAWEVIPRLAEHLIKEEIERLKAET
jgi:DNA-binding response OmpR family regulator